MKFGNIVVETTQSALGAPEQKTYTWQGGPFIALDVCSVYVDDEHCFIGPYKLRLLPGIYHTYPHSFIFIRTDYPFWRLFVFAHSASCWLRTIKSRIILTFAVWRLAEYRPECVPSFRDVYLVKRIEKIWPRKNVR